VNSLPTHMGRRGSAYYVRFRLPALLARKLGVPELRRSLNTDDFRLARIRCLAATLWFEALVETLSNMKSPTREDLEAAARAYFDELVVEVEQPRTLGDDGLGIEFQREEAGRYIEGQEANLAAQDYDDGTSRLAQALVERLDLAWAALPSDLQWLAKSFIARARRQQMRYFLHTLETPWQRFKSDDDLFEARRASDTQDRHGAEPAGPVASTAPPHAYRHPELTFERGCILYYQWKAEQGWGGSMEDESRRVLGWLEGEVGASTLLEAITRDQVREFRDCLLRLGTGAQGKKLPLRKRLAEDGEQRLTFATRERYWRFATSFFQWFASERDITDPSKDLQFKGGKDEVKRTPVPFSDEELQRLFETPLFAGHHSASRRMAPGNVIRRDTHWWSTMLMLFCGLRAGDCAQLLPKDVHLDDAIPYLIIRPGELPDGRAKTSKFRMREHTVPIHPTLIALGLREFVAKRAGRKPAVRLLEDVGLGQNRRSTGLTKFWSRYLHAFGLYLPGRATHVFRHTIANRLRAAGLTREEIGAILGHTTGNVTDGYGGPQPLKRKAEIIGKLDFGFDLLKALGGPYNPKVH
jgi:integrase